MKKTAYVNGTLIDGKGNKIERSTVLIFGNLIKQVGEKSEVDLRDDIEIIDIHNKTIMPGMIDAHTHHARNSSNNLITEISKDFLAVRSLKTYLNFKTTLEAGYTTVRDAGAMAYTDIAVRNMVNEKRLVGPRIVAAGRAICQTGGHSELCSQHPWAPLPEPIPEIADGEVEVRRAVRKQVRMGADYIKLFVTSGIYDPFSGRPRAEYSREEIAVAIDEAKASGKKIVVHCHLAEVAKMCIELGVASIEHGMFIDEECLEMMVKHDVFWIPTATVFYNILNNSDSNKESPVYANTKRGFSQMEGTFKKAYKLGVKVGMGTDAGTVLTEHGDNAKELEILNSWGMSAMDCITAATSRNAELLGVSKVTGSIERDKEADIIIIIDGDPLEDICILQDKKKIVTIMKGGDIIKNVMN